MTTEHGLFEAVPDHPRRVRGLLLPYGETSRLSASQTEPILFERGTVVIPRDAVVIGLNRKHDRFDPIGRAVALEDTDAGIVAEFDIANTDEGDEYLANRQHRKLSAEMTGLVRNAADRGRALFARLTGAAVVDEGAFASAALFAIGDVTEAQPSSETTSPAPLEPDADGDIAIDATATPSTVTVTAEAITTVFRPEDTTPPAAENLEASLMGDATAPNTVAPTTAKPEEMDANAVFEAITSVMSGQDFTGQGEQLLAALADIKTSGAGTLPVGGSAIQPAWLAEVHAANAYVTRYKSLIRRGPIVAFDEKGFAVATSSEAVQPWGGNKADIPTVNGTTSPLSSVFQRWGVGNDIAREFYDIPAGRPVIEAFLRLIDNSYDRVTDKWTLQQLVASAGAAVAYDGTGVPAGYNAALAKVIQVIDLVDNTDAEPTSVVVAGDVWKALRYTQKDMIPEYITFALRRTEGTADGVTVLKDKAGVLAAGQVLGLSTEAAHVNELNGGSPIHLEALDIARGGIDKAVIGYTQYMADYPAGLVLLGNAA